MIDLGTHSSSTWTSHRDVRGQPEGVARGPEDLAGDPRHLKITARMPGPHHQDGELAVGGKDQAPHPFRGRARAAATRAARRSLQVVLGAHEAALGTSCARRCSCPTAWRPRATAQPRFEQNFCHGHDEAGKVLEKDQGQQGSFGQHARDDSGTMPDSSAPCCVSRGLSARRGRRSLKPQIRIRSRSQMGVGPKDPEDPTTANDAIALSYGLGWGLLGRHTDAGPSRGHGDGWEHLRSRFPRPGPGRRDRRPTAPTGEHLQGAAEADDRGHLYALGVGELRAVRGTLELSCAAGNPGGAIRPSPRARSRRRGAVLPRTRPRLR